MIFQDYSDQQFTATARAGTVSENAVVNILEFNTDIGKLIGVRTVKATNLQVGAGIGLLCRSRRLRSSAAFRASTLPMATRCFASSGYSCQGQQQSGHPREKFVGQSYRGNEVLKAMTSIAENIACVREEMAKRLRSRRKGRKRGAARRRTKYQGVERMMEAAQAGIRVFGENHAQEL